MDLRKQKRLGPAPIASFEKSFEDSSAVVPNTNGLPAYGYMKHKVALTVTEPSEEIMDSIGNSGDDGAGTVATTVDIEKQIEPPHECKATPSKKQLHDVGGKRPAPIKTNVTIVGGFTEPIKSATLHTPSTPRIELSRASSSSHHEEDSRDSSPENVFEQVGTGTLQETIGLGFREEGALELRSSTEELYFMDPEAKKEEQDKIQQQLQQARRSSPLIFKFDEHQTYLQQHQRKDSASSEVAALLCISGRTSRISSVGSQGSAVSRLSAISGVSRSPSPHRMLLETSFCGPKPLENVVDGSIVSTVEPPTAEILEQVLLSRKHDPTQAVFAEGIRIESSPQKKKPPTSISNGEPKRKPTDLNRQSRQTVPKIGIGRGSRLTPSKSPGQVVVGTTPSGAEYIRINLKPDHMYEDKGIAPNERVVEALLPGARSMGHKKPISLSLGRNAIDEKRLTPSSSPKPSRHSALAKETLGSRSPSPANVSVSRKSSFCSLFKQKDSPDSPKDRARSRSKSRDRSTPQSQNPTPNKQKSVLAIFKPKRPEGKSKSSSPIDPDFGHHAPSSKTDAALETFTAAGSSSRPSSRLRYYDTPTDGKGIHIPLHTPPEEKEGRKVNQSAEARPQSAPTTVPSASIKPPTRKQSPIQNITTPAPPPASVHTSISKPTPTPISTPIPASNPETFLTPAPTIKPQPEPVKPSTTTAKVPYPQQEKVEKIQRIENLDAIHTLPQDIDDKERTWSLEVNRHSSQDSQDTVLSDNSLPNNCGAKVTTRPNLENVSESPIQENGISAEVHKVPLEPEANPPLGKPFEDAAGREKRRLLFATRLGSGSQEQIFSTQFSLSKTESLSSQLSEQTSISESLAQDHLQRKDTVIRRPDDAAITQKTIMRRLRSVDETIAPASGSRSTSEDDKHLQAIILRKKESAREEPRRKSSRSASEEDDVTTHRHSRYLENFDVRKKFHENVAARKSTAKEVTKEEDIKTTDEADKCNSQQPVIVQHEISASEPKPEPEREPGREPESKQTSDSSTPLPLAIVKHVTHSHHPPSDRQSVASTDEPVESSESERDSEADPNRIKRHLPRHMVSAIEEHESTGLVSQDSFDDELPYIPTTLPEERAHGVALIPMKERVHMELKTCPLDRPRSTTPLNPSHLEEYCGIVTPEVGSDTEYRPPVRGEKLRISLPRKDSTKEKAQKSKSPRRISTSSGKSWFEFAEEAIRGPPIENNKSVTSVKQADETALQQQTQPQAPTPTASTSATLPNNRKLSGQWIDFENIPEKRKAPKKITTLPKDSLADGRGMGVVVHYNYVKPEECQCECHEVERGSAVSHKSIASVDLLQQPGEDMQPLLGPEPLDNVDPSDSSRDYSCYTDDETEGPKSNRAQQARRSSPLIFKFDEHQTYLQQHQRKDSASSEVAALLCISGRTSRISSVGSQGSAVSRLSAISGVSRSPSPHRMLLETSFCGPKPLENVVDGSIVSTVEPPTAEILEQVLLSRKHDPTQAVFAEGIRIESSPQKKKPPTSISNGEPKRKPTDLNRQSRQTVPKIGIGRGSRLTPSKSPGQVVVGTTPSGAEYIRINLKPDHMYEDKGIAPNERVVEALLPGARSMGHKKPISLSLGRNAIDEKRLTPSSSPKPSRHSALAKETLGSRSPSPANVSVSRKSSFCSLFKQKDSPDSPKDRARSRSKSRDRSTPQSQNPTPNKQKSVLAIFKPKRPEGKSKSSSPIDPDFGHHAPSSKTDAALETFTAAGSSSRPSSRLRYYDTPTDGKGIHIPLHTPPEEKEGRKVNQSAEARPQSAPTTVPSASIKPPTRKQSPIQNITTPAPPPASVHTSISKPTPTPISTPIPASNPETFLTPAPTIKPQPEPVKPSTTTAKVPYPQQEKVEKIQRIENLDAIHTLPQDIDDKERTWSLEVNRHSSQDSQDTVLSDNSLPNNCGAKVTTRPNLENVSESPIQENGISAEVHKVPLEPEANPPLGKPFEDAAGREKRRLLFATRLGSGSQEQIFSTQFSLSKTESLSSQLSEQTSISESLAQDHLQRKDTVIRRPDDAAITQKTIMRRLRSVDETIAPASGSRSTSEDDKHLQAIILRKKESAREEPRRKSSRSASEEDDVTTHRHSRYLENFDVRKKFHENVAARKSTAKEVTKEEDIKTTDEADKCNSQQPVIVQHEISASEPKPEPEREPGREPESKQTSDSSTPLPLAIVKHVTHSHHPPSDRQSVASTDEPVESSESERDSEADPNRIKRHLPRHMVSAIEEHESTGLVSQDSFDDELPYIPTTLPEERAHGVALIPMKERVHMELKTCPLDRPRSTTPLNPSHLEEYCGIVTPEVGSDTEYRPPVRGEKLRISLPRKDSTKEKAQKSKSPRRISTSSGKSWFEFAEEAIRGPPIENNKSVTSVKQADETALQQQTQPQAPTPTASTSATLPNNRKLSGQWIDFENIPEKRKAPKKITTLPKDSLADGRGMGVVVHYNYVKPEECQCECHEVERGSAVSHKSIASVDLLQQPGEDMQPLLGPEPLDNVDPSDSSRDYSCYTDDETEGPKSNRAQNEEFPLRGVHSPRNKKFPDNRYT